MNEILKPLIGKCCVVYLDDILVFSPSSEAHWKHLTENFQLLREHKLYLNKAKCEFAMCIVHFLGFIISAQGVSMDPYKVTAVCDWPPPTHLQKLVVFMALLIFIDNLFASSV
ncbi:hypothetical protein KFK09_001480 [Dendrobium nobile]|uniref:Reverse transcriptase domain-containing protein n=1 Tax=Dendrobium nobile TaxID=94219 RepID=A0A8T3C4Z3_DENNO|nr:hypothetical protein KFK09_001480 [Dendrobium nobile]